MSLLFSFIISNVPFWFVPVLLIPPLYQYSLSIILSSLLFSPHPQFFILPLLSLLSIFYPPLLHSSLLPLFSMLSFCVLFYLSALPFFLLNTSPPSPLMSPPSVIASLPPFVFSLSFSFCANLCNMLSPKRIFAVRLFLLF